MKVRNMCGFLCKARARKSQYANTQRLTTVWSIRVLCVPRRHQKMQRRACIASRMLSSSVVSPRQTLRPKTKPSPSISGTAHAFTYTCASQCALFTKPPFICMSDCYAPSLRRGFALQCLLVCSGTPKRGTLICTASGLQSLLLFIAWRSQPACIISRIAN